MKTDRLLICLPVVRQCIGLEANFLKGILIAQVSLTETLKMF